ncbi:hypothetical protein [Paracoccus alkanivorans]|uniref:hypothetical protein n=1 Tax=Paracoccus alkanivorans TaxID=2116655 RepID=UPI00140BEDF0|nr:hypothetical protein [Paracoccus alkanivorans]
MDDFYTARSSTKPPLPWTNFAPPFSPIGEFCLKKATFEGSHSADPARSGDVVSFSTE